MSVKDIGAGHPHSVECQATPVAVLGYAVLTSASETSNGRPARPASGQSAATRLTPPPGSSNLPHADKAELGVPPANVHDFSEVMVDDEIVCSIHLRSRMNSSNLRPWIYD